MPDIPKMVIVPGIPVIEVGVEYPLSTGKVAFTEADLADAVKAANEEPAVKAPRMKLGHAEGSVWAGTETGQPNWGNFTNLRLTPDGQQILADLETWDWLAEVLPIAYPSRSIEGQLGHKTSTGRFYRLVIEAVAMLGVELPGVSTLDDVRELLTTRPEVAVVAEKAQVVVRAQADVEDVRRAFISQVAVGDRSWWWIRSMRLSPDEVIACDDESGELYRIPFSIQDHNVNFGDPVQVVTEYRDINDSEPAVAASRWTKTWATAASSRTFDDKEDGMDPKQLRAQLGLPEDATDEQVKSRISELRASVEQADDSVDTTSVEAGDGDDEDEDGDGEQSTPAPETAAQEEAPVAEPIGAVRVDAAAFRQLQLDARAGREARQEQLKVERDNALDQAIMAGKFPPASRDHYRKLWDKDPKGTRDFIDSLESNVIPVSAQADGASDASDTATDPLGGYGAPLTWYTEAERERIAAARGVTQKGS